MANYRESNADARGWAIVILAVLVGAAVLFTLMKAMPPLWRGAVEFTRGAKRPVGDLLHTVLGWPDEGSTNGMGVSALSGVLVWTVLTLGVSLVLGIFTGSWGLLRVLPALAAVFGALAGAASVAKSPSTQSEHSLDDYLHNDW